MKKPSQNVIAIRNVKEKLQKVSISEVATALKCTRQNIYYHLNENKSDSVSLPHLAKISAAIDKVLAAKKKADEKILATII